jgi:lysophospholipase L1-like esterase
MIVRGSMFQLSTIITIGLLSVLAVALAAIATFRRNVVEPAIPFFTDTLSHQPASCPSRAIVIVAFGQSLAANSGEHVYAPSPNDNLYLYFSGRCFQLADPLMGATGKDGSIWIPAATRLAALTGDPVVIIAGGVNGSSIAQWTMPRSQFTAPLRNRIDKATRFGLPPDIFIWMQGESDAERKTSADAYFADLRRLRTLFSDAPWLVTSNSICTNTPDRSPVLAQARRDFALVTPDVVVAADLDSLGTDYRISDRCHFNRQGQELAGTMIADAVAGMIRR